VVDIQYSETGHLNGRGAESFSFTAPRDGTFSVSLSSLQSYLDVDFFQIGRSRKHAASNRIDPPGGVVRFTIQAGKTYEYVIINPQNGLAADFKLETY